MEHWQRGGKRKRFIVSSGSHDRFNTSSELIQDEITYVSSFQSIQMSRKVICLLHLLLFYLLIETMSVAVCT